MDRAEQFKGGVHFVAGGLVAAMCLHNLMAWTVKGERRNGINAAVYALLFGFEAYNTLGHLRQA